MGSKVKMRNTLANGGMTGVDDNLNRIFAYRNGKNYSQVKKRVTARLSNTLAQQAVRNGFGGSSQEWSDLTEAQRVAYNEAAPDFTGTDQFGTTTPSGKNLRTATVIILASADMPATTIAPTAEIITDNRGANLETNGQFTLDYNNNDVGIGEKMQLSVSKLVSAGTYAQQKCSILYSTEMLANASDSIDVTARYVGKYGPLVFGKKVSWEVHIISQYGYKKRISFGTTMVNA